MTHGNCWIPSFTTADSEETLRWSSRTSECSPCSFRSAGRSAQCLFWISSCEWWDSAVSVCHECVVIYNMEDLTEVIDSFTSPFLKLSLIMWLVWRFLTWSSSSLFGGLVIVHMCDVEYRSSASFSEFLHRHKRWMGLGSYISSRLHFEHASFWCTANMCF
jgi:hypothetical protein